jgi:hypothetical protein
VDPIKKISSKSKKGCRHGSSSNPKSQYYKKRKIKKRLGRGIRIIER